MAKEMPEPVGGMAADGRWTKTSVSGSPALDADVQNELARVKEELKLEDRAAADGRDNCPARDDKTLNEAQMDVCSRVFAGIQMLNQFLDQQVGLAVQHARRLAPVRLDAAHIRNLTSSAIDRVFTEHRPILLQTRRDDLKKNRDLRFFVHDNKLRRSAHYEESVVKVAGIIVGLFVLELIINGSLFAEVVSTGLIGGAMLAGMISAINILSGVFAGLWGWRNLGHRRGKLRALGAILTLILHGIAIAWNLFVAHFREVAEDFAARDSFEFDISQIRDATVNHIQEHGIFGIESLQSWALLLLGIFIHFIAAKEGWDDFADRYPDYKKYDLLAKNAHEDFEEGLASLRDDVREAIEGIEEQAQATIVSARTAYQTTAELLDVALERQQEVRDSEDEWVGGGTRLLKTYREINLQIRDEGTAPAYFSTYPKAADYRRRNFGAISPPSDEIEERARCVDNSINELVQLRDSAKQAVESAETVLKDIHRHISNSMKLVDKRIDEECLKITKEAETLLAEDGLGQSSPEDAPRPARAEG